MQCPGCGFHNIPGLTACGRCGSPLQVAASAVDVHPPRASRLAKRMRPRWNFWGRRTLERIRQGRESIGSAVREQLGDAMSGELPRLGALLRSIVPGWGHRYLGHTIRARVFAWAFVACFVLDLMLFGTTLGNVMLGITFAVHASSVLDLFVGQFHRILDRIVLAVGIMVGLYVCLYMPVGVLLGEVALRRQFYANMGPIHAGDSVLVYCPGRPSFGSVVIYRLESSVRLGQNARGYQVVLPPGERVGRYLAGEGQHVVWDGVQMRVDGQLVRLDPTDEALALLPAKLDLIVPPSQSLIAPFGILEVPLGASDLVWKTLHLVNNTQIVGRPYMVTAPLSRRGRVY